MRTDRPRRAARARGAEGAVLPAGGRYFYKTRRAVQYERDEIDELLGLRVLLLKMDALLQLQYITSQSKDGERCGIARGLD